MSTIIETKNLCFEYVHFDDKGDKVAQPQVLNDVTLNIKAGEFIGILGHNGSGKSTLAKLLNALLLPTKGTLIVKGLDANNIDNAWFIRQSAGMVFQNPDNQIIAAVVEEDIAFGPENLGVPTKEIIQRIDEAINAVEMQEYRYHSPNKLSGGQKQRVAIAGVLAMKPQCIILDEPTAMLDPSGRKEVIQTIHRLNKEEGMTVILITHFMEETIKADRIYVMNKGKVMLEGKPRDIFSHVEELRSYGLAVPQITEIAEGLKKAGISINETVLTVEEMVDHLCRLK